MKVAKFGGTSLADASQIKKVLAIVQADPEIQYVVVSAPGKRNAEDRKITDLLYEWHRHQGLRLSLKEIKGIIRERYAEITRDLEISFDLDTEISEIECRIAGGASADYAASRGEYLSGKIIAAALGYDFIDPATCISFDQNGRYLKSDYPIQSALHKRRAVIPGFYGSMPDGTIRTFSRGGSDITGAIVAGAVNADVYENWTDVSGLLMADPRIVDSPRRIDVVTYRELRELSYMGASVFHEEAMFPVQGAGITTNIRNTNDPTDPGTLIVTDGARHEHQKHEGDVVTGIAGRKNFTVITVEKQMMNQEVGFVRRILTVLESNGVSFEHMPSGIDTLSIIIDDRQLKGNLEKILREIREACSPDTADAYPNMSMIAIVGQGMVDQVGVAARAFEFLGIGNINIRMINQGSSEMSIIIGVENDRFEKAIRALYHAFATPL